MELDIFIEQAKECARKAWLDMLRDIAERIPMQERRIHLALQNFDGLREI